MTPAKRTAPHILARRRLLERMRKQAAAGDRRLPGERLLCKEIGVGAVTLRKALKQLSSEGRILSVPRKGNFIGEVPEHLNIGVVIGDGSTVSFIHEPRVLAGCLETLSGYCVYLRMVQLRAPERAPAVFNEYGLDGCIWPMPDSSFFGKAGEAAAKAGMPVVPVALYQYRMDEASLPQTFVSVDYYGSGRLRTEFMLKRGHRKIACFCSPGSALYEGFIAAISSSGATHKPQWAMEPDEIFAKVPAILDEGEATAMVVNGGPEKMEKVFQALDGHPAGKDIELLVDYVGPSLPALLARHPGLKVAGVNHYPKKELGAAAAKSLMGNLQDGLPLVPVKLLSKICAPDGTFID